MLLRHRCPHRRVGHRSRSQEKPVNEIKIHLNLTKRTSERTFTIVNWPWKNSEAKRSVILVSKKRRLGIIRQALVYWPNRMHQLSNFFSSIWKLIAYRQKILQWNNSPKGVNLIFGKCCVTSTSNGCRDKNPEKNFQKLELFGFRKIW